MTVDPTSSEPALAAGDSAARDSNRLWWVLVLALLSRLVAMAAWPENLTDDRDGYLALADGLAHGRGFSVPGTDQPTAYRPPLFPLVLMPAAMVPSAIWVAVLHLLLGAITVWLTFRLALRLTARSDIAGGAALLVAVDPLLVRYATFPMTETLAACLVAALIVVAAGSGADATPSAARRRSMLAGALFGLAALCRPTVWAFAGLMGIWTLVCGIRRRIAGPRQSTTPSSFPLQRLRPGLLVTAAALVLLPWGVRNWLQFGRPLLMTTHGGYTLLLGNNAQFFREVVDQPWGTVWDGTHGGGQQAWAESINRQMDQARITGELDRDRWMRGQALAQIAADPRSFVRACWLRVRRFWGLMPIEGASDQAAWVRYGTGAFYTLMFLGAIAGVIHIVRQRSARWIPSLLMIAGFMSVHLFYWTNIRMRAPLVPILAVLAALGWCRLLRVRGAGPSPGE